MPKQPSTVILYHADCLDGFSAAWAAWKKLRDKAAYIPVPPNNRELPAIAKGKLVYTLDASFPVDVIPAVTKQVAALVVVDHHISNKKAAARATDSLFDLTHSGAVLAWKYFHGRTRVPKLLRHVEDQDLWHFKLAHTREVTVALSLYDMNMHTWDTLVRDMEKPARAKKYLMEGDVLLRQMHRRVGRLVAHAEEIVFEGHRCLMVNSPALTSEIGHALVQKGSPIGIIWSRRDNKVYVSLRSNGKVDVAKIAERYGGGGHKAAAGFSFEAKNFLRFKKKRV